MIGEEGDPLLKEDQDKNKENEHVQVNQFSKEDSRNFNSFQDAKTLDKLFSSIPSSHKAYHEEDKYRCPYLQMQKSGNKVNKTEDQDKKQDQTLNQDDDELSSSSDDEEQNSKREKDGCPFMPSNRKKNPGLEYIKECFSTHYLSRYATYLEEDSLISLKRDFSEILRKIPSKNRKIFDSYPIYLKHSLFHNDETMHTIRKKDIVERFFAYDKFRERANRLFNKKKYSEAIYLYERALSCFKWLEIKEDSEDDEQKSKEKKKKDQALKDQSVEIKEQEEGSEERKEEESKIKESTKSKGIEKQKHGLKNLKKNKNFWDEKEGEYEIEQDYDEQSIEAPIQGYGSSSNAIKELIGKRAEDLAEQEKQRQAMFEMRMKSKNEKGQDEQYSDNDSNKSSMSVEGFEDNDRNLSSEEEEKQIDINEICNKDPSETTIIMDEKEKSKLIAQEQFLRKTQKEDKELKNKYKLFITNFTDDNVILKDGEDLVDSNDIELRQSMLVNSYLYLGICYMNLGNLKEAMIALTEAKQIHKKGSLPLLRIAQCILIDKGSTYQDCKEGLEMMKMAMQLKEEEKIFNSGQSSLIVNNISNHLSFYQEIFDQLKNKANTVRDIEEDRLRDIFERVVELNEIESEMKLNGVNPIDQYCPSDTSVLSIDNLKSMEEELQILIEGKYYTLIESFMYYKQDNKQLQYTKEQLNIFKSTDVLMNYYQKLDFKQYQNDEIMAQLSQEYNIDMESDKNQLKFKSLSIEQVRDIFNQTQHNHQIYKWALADYMQKKKERLLKQQQSPSEPTNQESQQVPKQRIRQESIIKVLFGGSSLIQFALLFITLLLIVLLLRSFPEFQQFLPFALKK